MEINFTFEKHVNKLCSKNNRKVTRSNATCKIRKHLKETLYSISKACVASQFNDCPLNKAGVFHTKE